MALDLWSYIAGLAVGGVLGGVVGGFVFWQRSASREVAYVRKIAEVKWHADYWRKHARIHEERYYDALMKNRMPVQNQTSGLDQDMTKRLLFLCHPDKHHNSKASQLATEFLLKQRR